MPEYRSKERVVRDDVLIYPEGEIIPETDVAELQRQGFVKAAGPAADKAKAAATNKAAKKP